MTIDDIKKEFDAWYNTANFVDIEYMAFEGWKTQNKKPVIINELIEKYADEAYQFAPDAYVIETKHLEACEQANKQEIEE